MQKGFSKVIIGLIVTLFLITSISLAWAEGGQLITPRYNFTAEIVSTLTFSGGTAYCGGTVTPSGNYSSSVTVTLYRQDGDSWTYVASWYGSASNGATAAASGSKYVGSGTFKVTARGNIGNGLERPTNSVIRSN